MARVVKGCHSFTCTPRVHPLTEWTIPAFAFLAEAGRPTHLPTPEGWKAELAQSTFGRRLNAYLFDQWWTRPGDVVSLLSRVSGSVFHTEQNAQCTSTVQTAFLRTSQPYRLMDGEPWRCLHVAFRRRWVAIHLHGIVAFVSGRWCRQICICFVRKISLRTPLMSKTLAPGTR